MQPQILIVKLPEHVYKQQTNLKNKQKYMGTPPNGDPHFRTRAKTKIFTVLSSSLSVLFFSGVT